jgi:hypothetical protein
MSVQRAESVRAESEELAKIVKSLKGEGIAFQSRFRAG